MKIVGVIPSRYNSSRFPGKPLADIFGKPMIWWVYQQVKKASLLDEAFVATDDDRIEKACEEYGINCIMTSSLHDTPTSRLYEVSNKIEADYYVFIGGDEPLIEAESIDAIAFEAKQGECEVVHAMTKIKTAPEVIDFTNIKVVVNTCNNLLYTSRSPLPFPKGGLNFDYKKFVGIGAFSKKALTLYNRTKKSDLEKIEECDLIRFLEVGMAVKMVNVECRNVSVDTPKDLEAVKVIMQHGELKKSNKGC